MAPEERTAESLEMRDCVVPRLGRSQRPAQGDSPGQQDAQPQQQKARLMEAKAPQQLSGLIARVLLEIVLRGAIQKVHEPRILGLGKPVHDLANEQVEVQLAPQYA